MSKDTRKKVVVALPNTGTFPAITISALMAMEFPENSLVNFHFIANCLIYDARERAIEYMFKKDYDYILFIDSDMVPPRNTVKQLLAHDKPLVGATFFKRVPPFQPCFYTKAGITKDFKPICESCLEFPKKGLLEVEGIGMACTMIRKDVFEQLEKPYFHPLPNIGEDLTFCLKLKKKGIKMYVDLGLDCGHLATIPISRDHFEEAYKEYQKSYSNKPFFLNEDDNNG